MVEETSLPSSIFNLKFLDLSKNLKKKRNCNKNLKFTSYNTSSLVV